MSQRDRTRRPADGSPLAPELRRGALVLAILALLRTARYGYALREKLAAGGLDVVEGTLYPLLRRLEKQGLLTSEWYVEDNRPRRYYRTSARGERELKALNTSWDDLVAAVERLREQTD